MKRNNFTDRFAALILFFLLVGQLQIVAADEISLSSSLDKSDIAFEDSITLKVEIEWPGDLRNYTFELLPLPETSNLKVIGTSSTIASQEKNRTEVTVRTFKYNFRPTLAGVGKIEPIDVKYISWPDSIPGFLTTQAYQILIAEPLPPPEPFSLKPLIIIIVGAVIIIGVVLFILLGRKKKEVVVVRSAEEEFIDGLAIIKKESQGDRKVFFTRLYKVLVEYIERKYSIKVAGLSSAVMLGQLETKNLFPELKEPLTAWVKQAETEKYAPVGGTPGDIIRLISELEDFFQKTISGNIAEVK